MKRWVIDAIKQLIQNRIEKSGLKSLQLEWFGGEPLIAKDVVHEISEYANSFFKSGHLDEFEGGLTTNAYLLDIDTLARLVDHRQRNFQVSLDGDEDAHNRSRRYASGDGTFSTIWPNLLAAAESSLDFAITLRLHIMPGNESSLYALSERIRHNFGGDRRFTIYLRHISDLNNTNNVDKVLKTISMTDALRIASSLEHSLSETGFVVSNGVGNVFESQVKTISIGKPGSKVDAEAGNYGYICYAAKPNHMMIRADGRLGKCTVALNSQSNHVGQILPDGRVRIDDERMNYWLRGHANRDAQELGCPAHTY
jgi:uncharacterized protein